MRPYEVMIILDPTLDDDVIQAEVDRATELIKANGGMPGRVDRWGKRKLAYEIRRQMDGYYVLLEASAEPAAMAELDRSLHLSDPVMRHKVMRVPPEALKRNTPRSAPAPTASTPDPAPTSTVAETVPEPTAATADATGTESNGE